MTDRGYAAPRGVPLRARPGLLNRNLSQPVRPAVARDIAPQSWETLALLGLAGSVWLMFLVEAYQVIHWVAPLALGVILGFANLQMARISTAAIWTPLFAVRLSALVFLCLGSLGPLLLGEDTQRYVRSLYHYSDEEFAKVLLIWCVSTTLLIVSSGMMSRVGTTRLQPAVASGLSARGTLKLGLVFLFTGMCYAFAYEIPLYLGWNPVELPGSFSKLFQAAQAVGIFLVALWAMERGGFAHLAYLVPLSIILTVTLITLNKSIVVLSMMFLAIAVLYRGITYKRVALITIILLCTFSVLAPMISYARNTHAQKYGDLLGGTVEERLHYSLDYLNGERFDTETRSSPFSRLNFVAPAAYVVAKYDNGQPSSTIQSSAWTLVPRILWPDKPEVSSAGRELYKLITGRDISRLAMTAFADIYWNFGWVGNLILLPIWGVLLWKGTVISFNIVAQRDWLMLPLPLLCFQIGLALDGDFVTSILVPTALAVVAWFGLRIAMQFAQPARR
jgi:hypothetical protein